MVEFVDIEKLMHDKLDECNAWLDGKDAAIAKRDEARIALEKAEAEVAEYNDDAYVAELTAYRDGLKSKLGIVDEVVAEAHDEQLGEECAEQDPAPVVFVEQPLI